MSGAGRVLVCSPVMPAYDRESGSRRIFDLVEFFREAGWTVSFAAGNANDGERYAKILRQRGVATFVGFDEIEQVLAAGRFDVAILAFWFIAESLMPTIRALSPETRVIVDSIDLHFVRSARGTFLDPSRALDAEYASQMAREVNAYAAADGVLTVSQKEADLINDLVGDPNLAHMVPDAEDLPSSVVPFAERQGILFIGNFRHPPNVEAAQYLCEEIVPQLDPAVLAEHPVHIVGNALNETVRGYGAGLDHVRMVGWVPSVLPYLQHARVSVVPLLYGAGTKRKLIQALMVGTPTVSTSMGVEGLNLRDGENVLVADDPPDFADSTARLLGDAQLWERLAREGQAHIATAHGREAVRTRLMQTVSTILAQEVKLSKPIGSALQVGPLAAAQPRGGPAKQQPQGARVEKLRKRARALRVRNERLEARVESLERDLNSARARNKQLKAQKRSLKSRYERVQAHRDMLQERLQSMEASVTWRVFEPYRRLRLRLGGSKGAK